MRPSPSDFRQRVRLLMMQLGRKFGPGVVVDDSALRRICILEVGWRIRYWRARGRSAADPQQGRLL